MGRSPSKFLHKLHMNYDFVGNDTVLTVLVGFSFSVSDA